MSPARGTGRSSDEGPQTDATLQGHRWRDLRNDETNALGEEILVSTYPAGSCGCTTRKAPGTDIPLDPIFFVDADAIVRAQRWRGHDQRWRVHDQRWRVRAQRWRVRAQRWRGHGQR